MLGLIVMTRVANILLSQTWSLLLDDHQLNLQERKTRIDFLNARIQQSTGLIRCAFIVLSLVLLIIRPFLNRNNALVVCAKLPLIKSSLYLGQALIIMELETPLVRLGAAKPKIKPTKIYDALVVGSGPGGLMTCHELAKRAEHTLLLESGPTVLHSAMDFPASWQQHYTREGLELAKTWPPVNVAQGHGWGGGALVNGSIYRRPDADVIQNWSHLSTDKNFVENFNKALDELEMETQPQVNIGEFDLLNERIKGASQSLHRPFEYLKSWHTQKNQQILRTDLLEFLTHGARAQAQLSLSADFATKIKNENSYWTLENNQGEKYKSKNIFLAAGSLGTPQILKRSGLLKPSKINIGIQPFIRIVAELKEPLNPLSGRTPPFLMDPQEQRFRLNISSSSTMVLRTLFNLNNNILHLPTDELKRFLIFNVSITTWAQLLITKNDSKIQWKKTNLDIEKMAEGVRALALWTEALGATQLWVPGPNAFSFTKDEALSNSLQISKNSQWSIYHMSSCLPSSQQNQQAGLFLADSSQLPTPPRTNPQGSVMAYAKYTVQGQDSSRNSISSL